MKLTLPALCLCVGLAVGFAEPPAKPEPAVTPPYPPSKAITGVSFDAKTLRTEAPGSDIWPITWAADGHLYTSWGDGGGFGGTNKEGRVSFGVGRVEGGPTGYRGVNIAGGVNTPNKAPFDGKSEGMLALGDVLYLWRDGSGSDQKAFEGSELWRSDDRGATWRLTAVKFRATEGDFPKGDYGFFAVAVCQFGKGYEGARDEFVYMYAPEVNDPKHWDVQKPGQIALLRVAKKQIEDRKSYEFFAGTDGDGKPRWVKDVAKRKPTWVDEKNGTHRMAVSYNPGLKRYLLTTMTVNRDGWIGMYDAPEPWGPWTTVHLGRNPDLWGGKTILYTFVNKWASKDGRDFVLVFTRNDHWATVAGRFELP